MLPTSKANVNGSRRLAFWQLKDAISALNSGGLIAYPTEAVWGLGCDPFDYRAVKRLLLLKQRPMDKGLILVAANIDQLGLLLDFLSDKQIQRIASHNPEQPTTWLLPHHGLIPSWITGSHPTVAIRISQHPVVKSLCTHFDGLLVSTSANVTGFQPASTGLRVRSYFGGRIDAYTRGVVGHSVKPSTIVDLATGDILR